MHKIKALGFDLFNTLITIEGEVFREAINFLVQSLKDQGLEISRREFSEAYRNAALSFVSSAKKSGRETHNRFWVCSALADQGVILDPEDPIIQNAVEAYFRVFYQYSRIVPGTIHMLQSLSSKYRLGLLSNFTHPPAAKIILDLLGLRSYFPVVLISGELGYRKPHPYTFTILAYSLGVKKQELIYIGDDPESDVDGAFMAGVKAVWCTYLRDHDLSLATGLTAGQKQTPSTPAPRVSTWPELIDMLNRDLIFS